MQKQIGGVLLVAGTCLGSGIIALPMVLANLGIISSIALMFVIWAVVYYTSLISIELNLQAGTGLALGALGRRFSGRGAELLGNVCLKILSYSLLAVYLYGGSSVFKELILTYLGLDYSFNAIAAGYVLLVFAILLAPIYWIDHCNRILFLSLMGVIGILTFGLATTVKWSHLPLFSSHSHELSAWIPVIPVVFTSFGFQVIFHTLTNYCDKDPKVLKRVFFWGSLIPAIVYILWTVTILSVIFHHNPDFYLQMMKGGVEVGELIQVLSQVAAWPVIQVIVWWISLFAIITSVIGVGIGLFDSLNKILSQYIPQERSRKIIAALITMLPPYFAVIYISNAFIAVLGFAGMILAVIAILLPVYLFWKIKITHLHYPELNKKWLIWLSVIAAIIVIISEGITQSLT